MRGGLLVSDISHKCILMLFHTSGSVGCVMCTGTSLYLIIEAKLFQNC